MTKSTPSSPPGPAHVAALLAASIGAAAGAVQGPSPPGLMAGRARLRPDTYGNAGLRRHERAGFNGLQREA